MLAELFSVKQKAHIYQHTSDAKSQIYIFVYIFLVLCKTAIFCGKLLCVFNSAITSVFGSICDENLLAMSVAFKFLDVWIILDC